ncbi:MAG: alpha/beta fold hydrolase [Alphaproteobacteria bacterium]
MYTLFAKWFRNLSIGKIGNMREYELQEKTLDVSGLTISYTDTGPADGPLVFCVHGLLSTGRDFDFLAKALAQRGYRCIAITLPGRGKSGRFMHYMQYVPPNYVPYCLAVLEHEAPGQEFSWLGVSLGGILGMMLHSTLGRHQQYNVVRLGQWMFGHSSVPVAANLHDFSSKESVQQFSSNLSKLSDLMTSVPDGLKRLRQFPGQDYVPVDEVMDSASGDSGAQEDAHGSASMPVSVMSMPQSTVQMTRLIIIDVGGEIPAESMDLIGEIAHLPIVYESKDEAVNGLKKRCAGWGIEQDDHWNHMIEHSIVAREDGTFAFHYDEGVGRIQAIKNEALPLWHLWAGLEQPTLLVRGGKSRILPEDVARKMHERYTGEQMDEIVFEACGHVPNLMQDDHIDPVIRWLEKTETRQAEDIVLAG